MPSFPPPAIPRFLPIWLKTALCIGFVFPCLVLTASGQQPETFRQVDRPGSVDLETFDLSGLTIPRDEIHTLLPRDAIPALTDPPTQPAAEATWLRGTDRILVVVVEEVPLAVPLRMLDRHEVVNATIGDQPIALTYCPLCDSAAVFSRRVVHPDAGEQILEFGVSGALYNSNVLMYDRQYLGLWSQLGMRAVSGPLAGTQLETIPVRVLTFADYRDRYPSGAVVHGDPARYASAPYAQYFQSDRLLVPVRGVGDELPRKTLGLGIDDGQQTWFIPHTSPGKATRIETRHGTVAVEETDAGFEVLEAPAGVRTIQTFYYAWSAFFPGTKIIRAE